MGKSLIQIETPQTENQLLAIQDKAESAPVEFMQALIDLCEQLQGGYMNGAVNAKWFAEYAQITGTFTGAPTNAQTISIGGQNITAVTSGAVENEFDIAGTAAGNASACAAAINASTTLSKWVVASANNAVLTIRALMPGSMGNAITLADSFSNFTWAGGATRLAGGDQATDKDYVFGRVAESL